MGRRSRKHDRNIGGRNPSRRKRTQGLEDRLREILLAERASVAGGRDASAYVSAEWLAGRLGCRTPEVRALLPAMAREGLIHGRAHNELPGHNKLYSVRLEGGANDARSR